MKTRDGLLRAAVLNPIGSCTFLNDVTEEEMNEALRRHKEFMKEYPRNGEGLEAYVDASDTSYAGNAKMEEEKIIEAAAKAGQLNAANDHVDVAADGVEDESTKMNGFVKSAGALSNGSTGNLSNGYVEVDDVTWRRNRTDLSWRIEFTENLMKDIFDDGTLLIKHTKSLSVSHYSIY